MSLHAFLGGGRGLWIASLLAIAAGALSSLPHWLMPVAALLPASLMPIGLSRLDAGNALGTEPGNPAWLYWQWCPGSNPAQWCVDYESRELAFTSNVTIGLDQQAGFRKLRVRMHSSVLSLPLPHGLEFTLFGNIDQMEWGNSDCLPLLKSGTKASLRIVDLQVSGRSLPEHRLEPREVTAAGQVFALEGPLLNGSLQLDRDGAYGLRARIIASPDLDVSEITVNQSGRIACHRGARS